LGKACGTHGEDKYTQGLVAKYEGLITITILCARLGVGGRVILKWILQK
jgi:hypothetical protein